jgi:hypothetical protein
MNTKIFFDTEFTGLHQQTTLISLGLISDCGKKFYAEFTDYDETQVDDWIKENVINNLKCKINEGDTLNSDYSLTTSVDGGISDLYVYGDTNKVKTELLKFLSQFEGVEMWSDCLSYDWVLLNGLLAEYKNGYPQLPDNINYIPFDIATLFKVSGVDPDITRERYVDTRSVKNNKHNSLYDAIIIKKCYEKLTQTTITTKPFANMGRTQAKNDFQNQLNMATPI